MSNQSEPESKWPLEKALFMMAGTMTILSAVLAAVVSPWFLLLTGFVGLNQLLYVAVGACPASLILGRTCGLDSSYVKRAKASARNSSPEGAR